MQEIIGKKSNKTLCVRYQCEMQAVRLFLLICGLCGANIMVLWARCYASGNFHCAVAGCLFRLRIYLFLLRYLKFNFTILMAEIRLELECNVPSMFFILRRLSFYILKLYAHSTTQQLCFDAILSVGYIPVFVIVKTKFWNFIFINRIVKS